MPSTDRAETIQRFDSTGNGLFVTCRQRQDRFLHELGIIVGDEHRVLLASCEGGPEDNWPPSPPLQQILRQSIGDNPALLGVGMAGTGHWSASFMLCEPGSLELKIETAFSQSKADDHATLETKLATTYRQLVDCQFDTGRDQSFMIKQAGFPTVKVMAGRNTRMQLVGDQLIFRPSGVDRERAIQWEYQISFD